MKEKNRKRKGDKIRRVKGSSDRPVFNQARSVF